MEGSVIVSKVKEGKNNFGFTKTEKFEDMMKAGIIDPSKVVRELYNTRHLWLNSPYYRVYFRYS